MNPFSGQHDDQVPDAARPTPRPSAGGRAGRWVVDSMMPIWQILLLAGGGLMLLTFFLPWWRISIHLPEANERDRADIVNRVNKAVGKKSKWYLDYDVPLQDNESKTLFGWHTGAGITAFVFSFFIIGWGIVPWFVRLLRPWAWIGNFVCMIFGLVSFILALVWYSTAPGTDVSSYLSQFVIVGPYLLLPGSLAVFVGGLLGGIFGLLAFLKSFRPG